MSANDRRQPARCLPKWASAYFHEFADRYDREMLHRKDAFYRLLCTDDAGMQSLWKRVDLAGFWQPEEIIGDLIYSTDAAIENEEPQRSLRPKPVKEPRLSPQQTKARKLMLLLRELILATPPMCEAEKRKARLYLDIESLCIAFDVTTPPVDVEATRRRLGIEFTAGSKRGIIQHRKASDTIREKALKAARALLATSCQKFVLERLRTLITDLESWRSFQEEHGDDPEYISQKSGWADWLRVAHKRLQWYDDADSPAAVLTLRDWASLAATLWDVDVTEERIRQILRDG